MPEACPAVRKSKGGSSQRRPERGRDLAAEPYLDKSTASRVATTLKRKRHVTRVPDPRDGRAIVLTTTAAGRKLHDTIHQDLIDQPLDCRRA